ncbi:hypothetical protein MCCC1A01412_27005 [Bacillus anthracis]|uniref:YopX family protein n=1 Tax=Bacillus anthracis TaxID=1392 RepID=UPI0008FE7159|nr:YopX family protein [Bacillus anthracis]AXO94305.1 hypothetical protein DY471_18665 [Bacillus anthracis]OJD83404.1 hypothetical protein MCCC1A01412_27005 [Bacillus anthracis]
MQTVEFRAWEKEEKKMYHNVGLVGTLIILEHEQSGYDFCELDLTLYDQLDDKYDLMQYTGLKDKNGKKIFGGDILKDLDELPFYVEYSEKLGAFCFVDKFDSYGETKYTTKDLHWEDLELVGNIYENPELLDIENLIK